MHLYREGWPYHVTLRHRAAKTKARGVCVVNSIMTVVSWSTVHILAGQWFSTWGLPALGVTCTPGGLVISRAVFCFFQAKYPHWQCRTSVPSLGFFGSVRTERQISILIDSYLTVKSCFAFVRFRTVLSVFVWFYGVVLRCWLRFRACVCGRELSTALSIWGGRVLFSFNVWQDLSLR